MFLAWQKSKVTIKLKFYYSNLKNAVETVKIAVDSCYVLRQFLTPLPSIDFREIQGLFEEHVYGNVSYTPVILSRSQSREMVSRDLHTRDWFYIPRDERFGQLVKNIIRRCSTGNGAFRPFMIERLSLKHFKSNIFWQSFKMWRRSLQHSWTDTKYAIVHSIFLLGYL
jgi:hypothetical protein